MNKLINSVTLSLVLILTLTLAGCHGEKNETASIEDESEVQMAPVQKKANVDKLFYSGAIQPLQVNTVTSPVDGVIDSLNFNYGQIVSTGQLVIKISSNKLQNELHDAVSSFVKARDTYSNSKSNFEGTEQLYKEQIIAQHEYANEKSQVESNELSFLDAKFKLEQLIQSIPGLDEKLKNISLIDAKNIRSIFDKKFDEISLHSERNGIVLYPVKSTSKENSDKEIEVGTEVKKGQALLSVGDLSSLGVEFEAGEMEINKLKAGQPVLVTTAAVPDMTLTGKIYAVAVQAKNAQSYGDSAKFPVKVKVDTIPEKFQKELRVGMSVRIEVDLTSDPKINIPLSSLKKRNGEAQVQVVDPKTGKKTWRTVTPGTTSIDSVSIESGLNQDEAVVVHDPVKRHS